MIWNDDMLVAGLFTQFARWWLNARANAKTPEDKQHAKRFINMFTGVLNQKVDPKWTRVKPDEEHIIGEDEIVNFEYATTDIAKEDGKYKVKMYRYPSRIGGKKSYKHFPYLYQFITAHGRESINKIIDACGRDKLIYCQTDGIIIDMPHPPEALRSKIESGKLKVILEDCDVHMDCINRYHYTRGSDRCVPKKKK
jgi:hypothetical protein